MMAKQNWFKRKSGSEPEGSPEKKKVRPFPMDEGTTSQGAASTPSQLEGQVQRDCSRRLDDDFSQEALASKVEASTPSQEEEQDQRDSPRTLDEERDKKRAANKQ